ncbi:MAG: hypothetical protein KKE71_06675 [Nanoarchaeota archaeon]|nr:hypothetical protein [Nanoarchaeota archaeon]
MPQYFLEKRRGFVARYFQGTPVFRVSFSYPYSMPRSSQAIKEVMESVLSTFQNAPSGKYRLLTAESKLLWSGQLNGKNT